MEVIFEKCHYNNKDELIVQLKDLLKELSVSNFIKIALTCIPMGLYNSILLMKVNKKYCPNAMNLPECMSGIIFRLKKLPEIYSLLEPFIEKKDETFFQEILKISECVKKAKFGNVAFSYIEIEDKLDSKYILKYNQFLNGYVNQCYLGILEEDFDFFIDNFVIPFALTCEKCQVPSKPGYASIQIGI